MKKYIQYLKDSLLGKITLGILMVFMLIGIYCMMNIAQYIPSKYMTIGIISFVVIVLLLWLCHYKLPKVSLVLEVILCACLIFGAINIKKINHATKQMTTTQETLSVKIVVKKNSKITDKDDFSKLILAYVINDDEAYVKSTEILKENNKKVKKEKSYENTEKMYNALLNDKVDMMVMTTSTEADLDAIDENYVNTIKVIYEKEYPLEQAQSKPVDISKEPFTIYLQGTDISSGNSLQNKTGGNINSTGRGDVNILITINPNTNKVNLQVVPRDLYVYIPCRGGSSKLSYSGLWGGVQSSIYSIENKLGVKINYYAKINFTGLAELVDQLGGISFYSHYTYSINMDDIRKSSGSSRILHVKKGMNTVNGEEALCVARARKMLPLNERSRGFQQMEIIKGIFVKFAENPTYDRALKLLYSLGKNFTTNLPEEDFKKAFELVVELLPQLQTMENHSIEGEYKWHTDEVNGNYLYYFYPTEKELKNVKQRIDNILNDK